MQVWEVPTLYFDNFSKNSNKKYDINHRQLFDVKPSISGSSSKNIELPIVNKHKIKVPVDINSVGNISGGSRFFRGWGGGCQAIIWQIFGRKLHVNERNMDREGVDVLSILFGICHWYVLVKEGDLCFNDFSAKLDFRSFHSFCRTHVCMQTVLQGPLLHSLSRESGFNRVTV